MKQGHKKLPALFLILGNMPPPKVKFFLASLSVTVLCKHESKHMAFCLKTSRVSTKEMDEIKKDCERCRVAEFRKSLTLLWYDGVCCKIFRQWSTSYYFSFTIASTVLHSNLWWRKDHLHMYPILVQKKNSHKKGRIYMVRDKSIDIVCVGWISPWANRGSTHTR